MSRQGRQTKITDFIGQTPQPIFQNIRSVDDFEREESLVALVVERTVIERIFNLVELRSDTVRELLKSQPIDLYLDFFKSMAELFNELFSVKPMAAADVSAVNKLRAGIAQRVKILAMNLGVPYIERTHCDDEIFNKHVLRAICIGDRILVEESRLRKILEKRILDDKMVVELTDVLVERGKFVGIDAASAELGLVAPQLDVYLVTFAAAIKANYPQNDTFNLVIYPHPDSVADYFQGGVARMPPYFLTLEEIGQFAEYYEDRIREAVDNTVVYDAAERSTNTPKPQVVFIDGRLFPYEHRLADLTASHGKYVALSWDFFSRLIESVRGRGVPVVGVVKRQIVTYLWHVVKFNIFKKVRRIDAELALDYLLSVGGPESRDGTVALVLMSEYLKEVPSDAQALRTFAVLRPFYVMDERFVMLAERYVASRGISWEQFYQRYEQDVNFWYDVLHEMLDEEERGKLKHVAVELYSDEDEDTAFDGILKLASTVLASNVAMFYGTHVDVIKSFKTLYENGGIDPPFYLALPRYEVLLPSDADRNGVREWIYRALIAINDVRTFYAPYDYLIEQGPETRYAVLILPSVVKAAHDVATRQIRPVSALIEKALQKETKKHVAGIKRIIEEIRRYEKEGISVDWKRLESEVLEAYMRIKRRERERRARSRMKKV